MIHVVIPSKRPKATPKWYEKHGYQSKYKAVTAADQATLDAKEYVGEYFTNVMKKNKVIQDLLNGCTFKVGDIVTPFNEEELKTQDLCEIVEIVNNITQLDEWPKNNKVYVLKFKSQKTGKFFWCNPTYFKEHNVVVSDGV